MSSNIDIHNHISEYLESRKSEYLTPEFGYASWNPPNSMFNISNNLPDILLELEPATCRVFLKILSLLKRNHDPVMAVTLHIKYEYFKNLVGRTKYYSSIKELLDKGLLIPTLRKSVYIISIKHANKLFKPKLEL